MERRHLLKALLAGLSLAGASLPLLGATKTATDSDFNSFSSHTHGGSNGHFNGAAIIDAAFNLSRNVIGNDGCIQIRPADFNDVDLNIIAGKLL